MEKSNNTMFLSAQVPIQPSEQLCLKPGHHLEPLRFYCYSSQCRKVVCSFCAVKHHRDSKDHTVIDIKEAIVKRKTSFQDLRSSLRNKISSINAILSELLNKTKVLSQQQTEFKLSLEDTCRQRICAINQNKDQLLKKCDEAYNREQRRALQEFRNLSSFVDNGLEYIDSLAERIEKQPFLLDETTEMKKIKTILEYQYESPQSSTFNDIESIIPYVDYPLFGLAVFKAFQYFDRLKRNAIKRMSSGLKIMYLRRYMTAVLLISVATFMSMSLFSFNSSDQEIQFSRSDQIPGMVDTDYSTDVRSAERFCGSRIKLVRYDGISVHNLSSSFENGKTIVQDTVSSLNIDLVFTVHQLDEISVTLSLNSSARFIDLVQLNQTDPKQYITAHKITPNKPEGTESIDTHLFENSPDPLVETLSLNSDPKLYITAHKITLEYRLYCVITLIVIIMCFLFVMGTI